MSDSEAGSRDPEDERILEYARDLFQRLEIRKPEPDTVCWVNRMKASDIIVAYGRVMLPRQMRGKLSLEDLKPLVASSTIYYYLMVPRMKRAGLTRLILPLGLGEIPLVLGIFEFVRIEGSQYSIFLLLGIIVAWVIFALTVLRSYLFGFMKGLFFAADQRAASLVGKEALQGALGKVRDEGLEWKNPMTRLGFRPRVNERIERLQRSPE